MAIEKESVEVKRDYLHSIHSDFSSVAHQARDILIIEDNLKCLETKNVKVEIRVIEHGTGNYDGVITVGTEDKWATVKKLLCAQKEMLLLEMLNAMDDINSSAYAGNLLSPDRDLNISDLTNL